MKRQRTKTFLRAILNTETQMDVKLLLFYQFMEMCSLTQVSKKNKSEWLSEQGSISILISSYSQCYYILGQWLVPAFSILWPWLYRRVARPWALGCNDLGSRPTSALTSYVTSGRQKQSFIFSSAIRGKNPHHCGNAKVCCVYIWKCLVWSTAQLPNKIWAS